MEKIPKERPIFIIENSPLITSHGTSAIHMIRLGNAYQSFTLSVDPEMYEGSLCQG